MAHRRGLAAGLCTAPLRAQGGEVATVYVGREQWPFPIPLLRDASGAWAFGPEAGRETILARRIGRNELDLIALLRAYLRVQADYRRTDRDGDGVMEFGQHVGARQHQQAVSKAMRLVAISIVWIRRKTIADSARPGAMARKIR